MRRRARTRELLLLCTLVASCGGSSSTRPGTVALHPVWEGSAGVPAVVQTVEVRITTADETFRELVDPAATAGVAIAGVPLGDATVQIFGYDVRLLGLPDLNEVDVAASYASAGVDVLVTAGRTDVGDIEVEARPFVTELSPVPGAVDVPTNTRVEFLLALAVGQIDASTIDISVDGVTQVVAGETVGDAELEACEDGTANPCGGVDRGLGGFRFRASTAALPGLDTVTVDVDAAGGTPVRSLTYFYEFDTAEAGEG